MNLNKISKALQVSHGKGLVLMLMAFFFIATDIFAQDYTLELQHRRLGDQIGVEFWLRRNNSDADRIAAMSFAVTYNTDHLQPADPNTYNLHTTDSVRANVDNASPYVTITSPFHSANGFTALTAQGATNGTVSVNQLQVTNNNPTDSTSSSNYYDVDTDGRGTFVGILLFDIIDHANLTDSELTQIALNTNNTIGNFQLVGYSGQNVATLNDGNLELDDAGDMTVRGITVLNPKGPNEAVNRNKQYESLAVPGYPIYFERSGLITPEATQKYGTAEELAYSFRYSTDDGTTWSDEFIRVAEHREAASALSDVSHYTSGEIVTSTGTSAGYYITRGDGSQIPVQTGDGYGGILRVIWDDDPFFAERSERGRIRIRQLAETPTAADIDTRDTTDVFGISDANFILSRLFFLQMDGTCFLRSLEPFENPTQFTVEAWVNLTDIQTGTGIETGIIAASSGPNGEEGIWMLYLDEGMYPSFRVRDAEGGGPGRGEDGSIYIGTVKSPDALTNVTADVPIDTNANHASNWHHIAGVVEDNILSIYVDGELKDRKVNNNATDIRPLQNAGLGQNIYIAVNPNGTVDATDYFNGGIKEVKIWRKALNHREVKEYISGVDLPTTWTNPDVRSSLQFYYTLNGNGNDQATSTDGNQLGDNILNYYCDINATTAEALSEDRYPYRPDKGHIRITSPTSLSGVSNLSGSQFPVRWAGFGLGNVASSGSDLVIEFSRDGGNTWAYAIDENGLLLDDVDIEDGQDDWKPYESATVVGQYNDLQAVAPGDSNYCKEVQLRIRGTEDNNQNDILFTTETFEVGPYFALKNTGEGSIIAVEGTDDMNLLGGAAFLEAWIRPYRFPTSEEGFFPIINKVDSTSGTTHYAFRLLETGQLELVVGTSDGQTLSAQSNMIDMVDEPLVNSADSVWTHVGVFVNLANGSGQPTVKFYIDGNVQTADLGDLTTATSVNVNSTNTFPTYIGFEYRGDITNVEVDEDGNETITVTSINESFIGEMKGVRYWNGAPGGQDYSGAEPTDLTYFIQGAANVQASELLTDYRQNLVASFDMGGDALVAYDQEYNSLYSVINGAADSLSAKVIVNNGVKFTCVRPYVKMAEPQYEDEVAQSETDLRVRWIGFHYDRTGFNTGEAATSTASDLEWSADGGGDINNEPYNPTSSDNDDGSFTDSWELPLTSSFKFEGTNPPHTQFAGELNISTANYNSNNGTQEAVPANINDTKLRINAEATVNSPTAYDFNTFDNLRDVTELFTITPPSNFTIRTLLEGYHQGGVTPFTGVLGSDWSSNAIKVTLFNDQSGMPGAEVTVDTSASDYVGKNPLSPTARLFNGSQFGDIQFVFTSVPDDNYFVLVEHQNHLPILSRYAAPFQYVGDAEGTWAVESGWDFSSWDGDTTDVLTEANATAGNIANSYAAWGVATIEENAGEFSVDWARTALRYNEGQAGSTVTSQSLGALVAGDIVRDGMINSADLTLVRLDAGSSNQRSDITGDGAVTALDRNIADRNDGSVASVTDVISWEDLYGGASGMVEIDDTETGPYNILLKDAKEMSRLINDRANQAVINPSQFDRPKQVIKSSRNDATQSGAYQFKVYSETEYSEAEGIIYLTVFMENEGKEFAPGNCTFAFEYDNNNLDYLGLTNTEMSIFSNVPGTGYFKTYSAPLPSAPQPFDNIRTVEIDYDNRTVKGVKFSGNNLPYEKTQVGTLVFAIRNPDVANEFDFKWHKTTIVLDTYGNNLTGDGDFIDGDGVDQTTDLSLINPNGGEVWKVGTSYYISWNKPSFEQIIDLELSLDRGATWIGLNEAPLSAQTGSFEYRVEDFETSEALVRILDANTGDQLDVSDNVFIITRPRNEITKPRTSDPIYFGGQLSTIEWVVDVPSMVRFEFSADGKTNWREIVASVNSQNGQVEWVVPANVNSKKAVIAMYNAESGQFLALSEPFRVLSGSMAFTSPNTGDMIRETNTFVRWDSDNVARFDLQFSADGGLNWETVEMAVNGVKGWYDWTVASVSTDRAVLRAVFNNDPALEYARTGEFSIDLGTDVEEELGDFTVNDPVPNPFDVETRIEFTLPETTSVTAELYNSAGVKVAVVLDNVIFTEGRNTMNVSGDQLVNGVYYLHIKASSKEIVKEVVVVK